MPTYEYECKTCIISTEIFARMNEKFDYPICPKCEQPMERKFQATPTIFKSKGFYSTDNK